MKIVGRLLKKTAEIGYKRNFNKGLSFDYQKKSLIYLIEKAKKTNFGKNHDFQELLSSRTIVKDYQNEVPIVDYDEYFTTWLHRSIDGVKDNTWPGKIKYYALSSGTTGSPSKRIPVTKETIKSFQKTSIKQASTLHALDLRAEFFQKSILVVGGSTKLEQVQNHIEGDLSGILKKHTAWVVTPFTQPENRIANIKDWNKKLDKMVQKASKWDIGTVAGVPSWCIMLMERIIEKHQLKSIHEIWPNFSVYVHGGVFMQPYLKRFERICGKPVHLLDTYLASEGYFAYQDQPNINSMRLLMNNQIFYEFIPFNSDYFTADGKLINKYKALTVNQVKENVDYALVISTNAGLWRYLIGDLIQFTDVENRLMKITGRIKQYLSMVGEHLSLDNINQAIESVCKDMNVEVNEYCIYCDTLNQRHAWTIGVNGCVDTEMFIQKLDDQLGKLNDDYSSVRKASLNKPTLSVVKNDLFYKYMEAMGKLGSQNKFPRVMNEHQASEWKRYLASHNSF